MKENDLHKYIEAQDPEGKQALKARIDARLATEQAPAPKPVPKRKRYIFSLAAACACLLCLVVSLPFILHKDKSPKRFAWTENDFTPENIAQTVKEYGEENNLPLLYLDRYDMVDTDVITTRYTLKNGNPSFYMKEQFDNGILRIEIRFTDIDTYIPALELDLKTAERQTINKTSVYCQYDDISISLSQFTYKGYTYYISVQDTADPAAALQIAESLLQTAK